MIEIEKICQQTVDDELERLRKEHHEKCAAVVMAWLTGPARKRPGPDLPDKLKKMTKKVYRLTETMKLKMVDGELVVNAEGSSEQTLTQLLLGTNWFEPDVDLVAQIYSGLFGASS